MTPTYPTGITPHPNHPPQTAKAPVLYACMHLGMHTKKPGKSPKTLIYKGKNKIPFSCMHCMHQYMGSPSFFSNPL